MAITAPSLVSARDALIDLAQQRQQLVLTVQAQGKKIFDLEHEVQRMATALSSAQQALADAKVEIEALRSQIPDHQTVRAFEDLVEYMSGAADQQPALRLAA
jgi:hypothetical protein